MGDVIKTVTTPLALAALLLLVAAGVLRAAFKANPKAATSANTKLMMHYGFVLAIALSVMANAAFLVSASFRREIRLSGTVDDDTGKVVENAFIDVAGRGGARTDDRGQFVLVVPDVWAADRYEAKVYRDGYPPTEAVFIGRRPEPIRVTLKRPPLNAAGIMRFEPQAVVSHYLGQPRVEVSITFLNPSPGPILLEGITLSLLGPDGARIPLTVEGVVDPMSRMVIPMPITTVDLRPGQEFPLRYSAVRTDQSWVNEIAALSATVPRLDQVGPPDPTKRPVPKATADALRALATSRMVWKPGAWKLECAAKVGTQTLAATASFALSETAVAEMNAVQRHYESGIGVMTIPAYMYWQGDGVRPAQEVRVLPDSGG